MNNTLIKVSAQVHKHWRQMGNVEFIIERYAKPNKPTHIKLWVVNGEHEFTRNKDCFEFCCRLSDAAGGEGTPSAESYGNIIKTYTEQAYKQAMQSA